MTESKKAPTLSLADVSRLMADPSPRTRATTTSKIAQKFSAMELGPAEREIASEIFRVMVRDTELLVRQSLAAHLRATPHLPHDIALALAKDVDSVALPVLTFSEVLADEDLIQIIRSQSATKQVAIAGRRQVSSSVSDALVESGNAEAVARLVGNAGAEVSEKTFETVIDDYRDHPGVQDSLAHRPKLPAAIAERLIAAVSQRLHDYLIDRHDLPADLASGLVLQARERTIITLVDYGSTEAELDLLVDQLCRKGRLTPSLLLRALMVGDINFFERSMGRLTGLPLKNVRILLHDKGMRGLEPLYLRADLPRAFFPAFRAAVSLAVEMDYDGGEDDRRRYVERMIERMLTRLEEPDKELGSVDLEYLMAKLQLVAA